MNEVPKAKVNGQLKCQCIKADGTQCTNNAKPPTEFCGLHKNCKNPIVIEDVAVEVVPDVLNVEIIPEKAKTKRVQKETIKTKRVQKVKEEKQQCHCIKANNERCTNNAIPNSEFCGIHSKNCKNPIK